jgi:hypothetical protein
MKHTIELTDDQLTVLIALMHLGVAAVSGEPLPEAYMLLRSVKDDEARAEEVQEILLKASKPESWERTKRYFSARNN